AVLQTANRDRCIIRSRPSIALDQPVCPLDHSIGRPAMTGDDAIGVLPERGASSRCTYRTSQAETPVKDARSPQNAAAFWLPRAPLRGAFGVLDWRFAGRCQDLSSIRRTATLEVPMSHIHTHPHAEFDRFPMLVESVKEEFGTDGLMSNVER